MIDEIRKKVEALKQKCTDKVKSFNEQKYIPNFKTKIRQFFFKPKEECDSLNDLLFLLRYSLKYKSVCTWPSNDLLIININLNDNFKHLMNKNDAFFENFKKNIIGSQKENLATGELYIQEKQNYVSDDESTANTIPLKQYICNSNEKKEPMSPTFNNHFSDDVSLFNRIKLQIFMYLILNNYRVKILIESLSAMKRPINIIYINCPNNKQPKRTISEKFAHLFAPKYKMNDIATNKKELPETDASQTLHKAKNEVQNKLINSCVSCAHKEPLVLNESVSAIQTDKKNYTAGYNPINNTIWICANNVNNVYTLKYILLHELLHAFDFARANIDVYNCHHIACTEIRAYNMSSQCGYFNSKYFKGNVNVFEQLKSEQIQNTQKNKCIYNNVYATLCQFKPCKNNAEKYINDVFQKCTHDYWPFMCAPERDSKYKPSKIMRKEY